MNNPLNGGESNTRAFERLLRVKPLENTKQLILILHIKTDSVIFHQYDHFLRSLV